MHWLNRKEIERGKKLISDANTQQPISSTEGEIRNEMAEVWLWANRFALIQMAEVAAERGAGSWRDDDSPQSETTFGVCKPMKRFSIVLCVLFALLLIVPASADASHGRRLGSRVVRVFGGIRNARPKPLQRLRRARGERGRVFGGLRGGCAGGVCQL